MASVTLHGHVHFTTEPEMQRPEIVPTQLHISHINRLKRPNEQIPNSNRSVLEFEYHVKPSTL